MGHEPGHVDIPPPTRKVLLAFIFILASAILLLLSLGQLNIKEVFINKKSHK